MYGLFLDRYPMLAVTGILMQLSNTLVFVPVQPHFRIKQEKTQEEATEEGPKKLKKKNLFKNLKKKKRRRRKFFCFG